ncbi:MAG: hypothetical protein RhofKO_24910 [Rhodothermales bacterium]
MLPAQWSILDIEDERPGRHIEVANEALLHLALDQISMYAEAGRLYIG